MNQTVFVGKVISVLGKKAYKTRNGELRYSRKFWAEEKDYSANVKSNYTNVLEFEINQSESAISPNIAHCEDLDSVRVGNIVRFSFTIRGTLYNNGTTGEQKVWNKLLVCSRIELIESHRTYAKKAEANALKTLQEKQLIAAKAQAVLDNRDPDEVTAPF